VRHVGLGPGVYPTTAPAGFCRAARLLDKMSLDRLVIPPKDKMPTAEPISIEELCSLAQSHNREGLLLLRNKRPDEALKRLMEAHRLLHAVDDNMSLVEGPGCQRIVSMVHAETVSHLGVYYRRMGSRDLALGHLEEALQLFLDAKAEWRVLAAAHLNLAVYQLELLMPEAALQHAQAAVDLGGQLVAEAETRQTPDDRDGLNAQAIAKSKDEDYVLLAVAYRNVGEAYEGLREWGKSTFAYTQGYEVVRQSLGPKHPLTKNFEKSRRCMKHNLLFGQSTLQQQQGRGQSDSVRYRLPTIPRRNHSKFPQDLLQDYVLNQETLAPWPPRLASCEERAWYSMAHNAQQQLRMQNRVSVPVPSAAANRSTLTRRAVGTEPVLEA